MSKLIHTPQIIRARPSKHGGYNISPKGGMSYPDRVILNHPLGGIMVIRRSDPEFHKTIKTHLENGYTIDNGRMNSAEIAQFQIQTYIESILNKK